MTSVVVPDHPWLLPGMLAASPDDERRRPRRTTRDWIVDGVCFLLAIGWVALVTWDAGRPDPQVTTPLPATWMITADAVLGVLASLALWFRRRWPVGLAIAVLPLSMFSSASLVTQAITLFTVAVHRRFATTATIAVLSGLGTNFVYVWLRPEPDMSYWPAAIWGVLFTVLIVGWGMFVRARRQLVVSLRERAHRAEAEQQLRVAQARHLERTRIAREMHDVLAHRISLLSLHAGALEFRPDAPPAEVAKAAGVIRGSAHAVLEDLREVIGVLRADGEGAADRSAAPERPQPTLADVPTLVTESRAAGMRLTVRDLVTEPASAPAAVGRSAYRIAQEGLTNARKHAPGAAVELALSGGPGDGLTVEITNRWPVGVPAQPAGPSGPALPGAGTGLVGIAERVHLAGGRLTHGRTGDSFRLVAWLPWPV
ncbi:sensor histidine kinase [Plantactinospora sp. GCM10030261]|uniref:sensor histidine kinase n=1 Tax=Plantactinospora sp. GCM10030261 TaxID=3273420 RepID=UPI003607DB36